MNTALQVFSVLQDGAALPQYQTEEASGADLHAWLSEPYTLRPMERKLISTGLAVELPKGYEIQIRPRSGLALKHGVTVLNTPGTVDADYRGELKVLLINLSNEPFTVNKGDRIAQAVIAPVIQASFTIKEALSETTRGTGGYGSTGIA